MYAAMFPLLLDGEASSRARGQHGRALASALAVLPGFVAFIALEAEDGAVRGLCICADDATLTEAQEFALEWQGEHDDTAVSPIPACIRGRIIVQHGL